MLENYDKFADIKIKNNDKIYKLHKIVLYQIPWFSKILNGNFEESTFDIIETNFDANIWDEVIQFLYKKLNNISNEIEKENTICCIENIKDNFLYEYEKKLFCEFLGLDSFCKSFDASICNIIDTIPGIDTIAGFDYLDLLYVRNTNYNYELMWNQIGQISEIPYYWLLCASVIHHFEENEIFEEKDVQIILKYPRLCYLINILLSSSYYHGFGRSTGILDIIFSQNYQKFPFNNELLDCLPLHSNDIRYKYGTHLKAKISEHIICGLQDKSIILSEDLVLKFINIRHHIINTDISDLIIDNYFHLLETYDLYYLDAIHKIPFLIQHGKNIHLIDPSTNQSLNTLLTNDKYNRHTSRHIWLSYIEKL